jgi:hypothetical protein
MGREWMRRSTKSSWGKNNVVAQEKERKSRGKE